MDATRWTFLLLLLRLSVGHAQQLEGRPCLLENGVFGVCRSVSECPDPGSSPVFCSLGSLVCCSGETTRGRNFTIVDENTVAGKKCREYARGVYREIEVPSLSVIPENVKVNECVPNDRTLRSASSNYAEDREFPHMAVLGYGPEKDSIRWLCGGSLISERYILTTAVCARPQSFGPVSWARLGVVNLRGANDEERSHWVTMRVAEGIVHPDYKPSSFYHDIALLRLESDVTFSSFIRPACLYTGPAHTGSATALGWGMVNHTEQVASDKLKKIGLEIQDTSSCNDTFRSLIGTRLQTGIDADSMVCAVSSDREWDTCNGDAGGPLQINLQEPDLGCMYSIIGITSFGSRTCGQEVPSVYTRVSHYVPWIESIVWKDN